MRILGRKTWADVIYRINMENWRMRSFKRRLIFFPNFDGKFKISISAYIKYFPLS